MPTTSLSSPTTTSAVNEKRRPPLTTLATRLISTTRSWRSSPAGLTLRSMAVCVPMKLLNRQAGLARALGQRLDAAVVAVPAAVEDRALDARRLGPLGEQRADARRLLEALEVAHAGLGPLRGRHGAARLVVDELREDPAVGAADRQARPRGGADDLGAHAAPAAQALLLPGLHSHANSLPRPHEGAAFVLEGIAQQFLTRACPPSGPRTRPRSGCPCPCRAPAGASCGCWRRPRRRAACRCPSRSRGWAAGPRR